LIYELSQIEQLLKTKTRIATTQEFANTRIALTKNRLDAAHTQNNITFTTLAETKKQPGCGTSIRLASFPKTTLKRKRSHCLFRKPKPAASTNVLPRAITPPTGAAVEVIVLR